MEAVFKFKEEVHMKYIVIICSLFLFSNSAFSEEWRHEVHGSFPVFFTFSDTDGGEQGSRIMSGFNPASLNLSSYAPTQNGIDISATLQITSHLQGSQVQNSGLFESRVADIQINGDFGQINVGKGFGIFNSNAIGDMGSAKGIGHMPGGADQGNATNGHIGTGYVYANFNPRIIYSNKINEGMDYKVGVFNPEEPANVGTVETVLPRIEGQLTVSKTDLKIWAGFMFQKVESTVENYNIQAIDIGGHFTSGAMGLRAAYTMTTGVGADGLYGFGGISDAKVDGSQAYVEATYQVDSVILGTSYGIGAQDSGTNVSGAIPEIENTLIMLFAHKKLNDNLHTMLELQSYSSETNSIATQEYIAVSTGIQVDF